MLTIIGGLVVLLAVLVIGADRLEAWARRERIEHYEQVVFAPAHIVEKPAVEPRRFAQRGYRPMYLDGFEFGKETEDVV